MKPAPWKICGAPGFTLVEILLALAVLSLLIVIIAQLMSGTAKIINFDENQMGVEGQARAVFASIGNDLANMPHRTDTDCLFNKLTGNDQMFFYSQMPGYFNSSINSANRSPLSVVGYRINSSTYQLERFCKGLTWDDASGGTYTSGPIYLTFPSSIATNPVSGSTFTTKWPTEITANEASSPPTSTTNYQVIGDEIFRLEFCYLLKDGTLSNTPSMAAGSLSAEAAPPLYYQGTTPVYGLEDVSALIVAIALIDDNSRKIISTSALANLANALPDSSLSGTPPTLMATAWQNKINGTSFASSAAVPVTVSSAIKVYQYYFYVNPN